MLDRLKGQTKTAGERRCSNTNSNANSASAGNILINTARLNIGNGGLLSAETSGNSNGGNIIINATESVALGEGVEDFSPVISVEASGAGRSGNIEINTPNFRLAETARITATSKDTATNPDSGGSVTLNADRLDLALGDLVLEFDLRFVEIDHRFVNVEVMPIRHAPLK